MSSFSGAVLSLQWQGIKPGFLALEQAKFYLSLYRRYRLNNSSK